MRYSKTTRRRFNDKWTISGFLGNQWIKDSSPRTGVYLNTPNVHAAVTGAHIDRLAAAVQLAVQFFVVVVVLC